MTKNQRSLRQRRDDVLADAVGEIFLLRIAGHVGERKDRDGGPVGQRKGLSRRFLGIRPALHGDLRDTPPRTDGPDEAQTFARDRADQPLFFAAVADRLARRIDAAGQRRIRHDAAAPDRCDEIVLADDAVAILHEIDQEIEYLRLDRNRLRAAVQFAPVGIKCVIGKVKLHVHASGQSASQGIVRPISRTNQAAAQRLPRPDGPATSPRSKGRSIPWAAYRFSLRRRIIRRFFRDVSLRDRVRVRARGAENDRYGRRRPDGAKP